MGLQAMSFKSDSCSKMKFKYSLLDGIIPPLIPVYRSHHIINAQKNQAVKKSIWHLGMSSSMTNAP